MTKPVAVISGSTSGIGLAIAKTLLTENYQVFINGRNQEKAEKALHFLKQTGGDINLLMGDANAQENYDLWLEQINQCSDQIDLIVANIGSGKGSNSTVPSIDEYRRMLDINFLTAVQFSQQMLPFLGNNTNIIFISSIAGVDPIGAPIPYACAKAALNMYAKEMAMRLAVKGIRVNCISPGNVIFEGSTWDEKIKNEPSKTHDYIKHAVPLQRFIEPEEIAKMVVTIVNTPGITAQNIVIDGGQTKGHS